MAPIYAERRKLTEEQHQLSQTHFTEAEAFREAIKGGATRLPFSDWLEEKGFARIAEEERELQRQADFVAEYWAAQVKWRAEYEAEQKKRRRDFARHIAAIRRARAAFLKQG